MKAMCKEKSFRFGKNTEPSDTVTRDFIGNKIEKFNHLAQMSISATDLLLIFSRPIYV